MIRGLLVCAVLGAAVPALAQPRPAVPPAAFDASGWTFIGAQTVDGHRDRDTLVVGAYEGKFDQLTMVVTDSDLELKDLTVVFGNGERWAPKLAHFFKEGQRSRAIDLPGNNRAIQKIELRYANVPGGGKARVSLFGRDTRQKKPPAFDSRGWTLLGSQTVDGRRDRDTIMVGRYEDR